MYFLSLQSFLMPLSIYNTSLKASVMLTFFVLGITYNTSLKASVVLKIFLLFVVPSEHHSLCIYGEEW